MTSTVRYTLPSADGQNTLSGLALVPDTPRACLELSHGMAEHTERYLPFMEYLAQNGILVFGHDHIGHGRSVSSSKDLGYLPMKNGEKTVVSDILSDAKRMKAEHPQLPLFLFGHSMGSFIARLAAAEDADGIYSGVILSGTGGPTSGVDAGILLIRLIAAFRGERGYSDFLQNVIFGSYNRRCPGRTEFDWLSRDDKAVDAYLADPLCGYRFPITGLYVLSCLTRDANRSKTFSATRTALPVLLMSGEEDPVGGYGAGVRKVSDAYRQAGCKEVGLRLYPGARHEPHNETNRSDVYADILAWICANSGSER